MPPQFDARSPGVLSTWREYKQCGQWFVYPLPETNAPQLAHVKSSTVFVNRFITAPMHYDTFGLIRLLRPVRPGPFYASVSSGEYILDRNRQI